MKKIFVLFTSLIVGTCLLACSGCKKTVTNHIDITLEGQEASDAYDALFDYLSTIDKVKVTKESEDEYIMPRTAYAVGTSYYSIIEWSGFTEYSWAWIEDGKYYAALWYSDEYSGDLSEGKDYYDDYNRDFLMWFNEFYDYEPISFSFTKKGDETTKGDKVESSKFQCTLTVQYEEGDSDEFVLEVENGIIKQIVETDRFDGESEIITYTFEYDFDFTFEKPDDSLFEN